MTRCRKYIFLFPLKCLSFKCQVVNQQLKQCLSLMLEWNTSPYLHQKKLQNNNTLLESTYFGVKDISIHDCCQAKQMYLFLVFPHTKLVVALNITITVFIFINFVKIMQNIPGCLLLLWTVLERSSQTTMRLCTKLCRMLWKTRYQEKDIREQKFSFKSG